MTRLAITVEGQTERAFVIAILIEHLRIHGVESTPILIGRARDSGAVGGGVSVKRLAGEMVHLLRSSDAVTCLVDFYGFRKKGDDTVEELEERIRTAIARRVRSRQRARSVVPYIQRYEFEALLFSDVECFGGLDEVSEGVVEALRGIRRAFDTPEDIDDGRETAPSKRIGAAIRNYDKVKHGVEVAQRIGLPRIRASCRRFDRWVRCLESLGNEPSAREGRLSEWP